MNRRRTLQSLLTALATAMMLTVSLGVTSPAAADRNPSVSGHATRTVAGERWSISFIAVGHKDGSVTGQAQLFSPFRSPGSTDPAERYHIAIDCLLIAGNQAWMVGTVTQSSVPDGPFGVGSVVFFGVEDNGEGSKASGPDRITFDFRGRAGSLGFWCFFLGLIGFPISDAELFPIEGGNIQVRP